MRSWARCSRLPASFWFPYDPCLYHGPHYYVKKNVLVPILEPSEFPHPNFPSQPEVRWHRWRLTTWTEGLLWNVISKLPKFLVALALAGSIGLHWAFFQSVAWVGMVISYSQQAPLTEALSQTFDGKHPCSLCNKIAEAKKGQHKSERQFEAKKLECVDLSRGNPLVPTAWAVCPRCSNTAAE